MYVNFEQSTKNHNFVFEYQRSIMYNSKGQYFGESVSRGDIPKDIWFLLQYAVNGDFAQIKRIKSRIEKDGKELVPVYPGVPGLMKGIDVSKMELIGSIIDGSLYLK